MYLQINLYYRTNQELIERRRFLQTKARLQTIKKEEKEKIKEGKSPFFLKKSARKEIALEERFEIIYL